MSQSTVGGERSPGQVSQLTLRVRHPDCWALESTARADAGLLVRGVYHTGEVTRARCTAYADSRADVEALVGAIDDTPLTEGVAPLPGGDRHTTGESAAGNSTEGLLVEYRTRDGIHDAFVARGFVPEESIRVHGGEEHWTVVTTEDRPAIRGHLDEVRAEMHAEISVDGMRSLRAGSGSGSSDATPTARLSERQREVFRLAQREGYYAWPREVSADGLATELGLSKTTVLEHLRKAEAKLLGPV